MAAAAARMGSAAAQGQESRRRAGHLRFAIPKRYGGKDGSNLWMALSASISPRRV
jgi:hypothetical protein